MLQICFFVKLNKIMSKKKDNVSFSFVFPYTTSSPGCLEAFNLPCVRDGVY